MYVFHQGKIGHHPLMIAVAEKVEPLPGHIDGMQMPFAREGVERFRYIALQTFLNDDSFEFLARLERLDDGAQAVDHVFGLLGTFVHKLRFRALRAFITFAKRD